MERLAPPPIAARGDEVDVLHGERIADPYRWLERDGRATREWTDAQNARTRTALDTVAERAQLAARLRELLGVGLLGVPRPVGDRVFYERRAPGQRQSVLLVRANGRERALVDPNGLDPDGLITLDWWYPSLDGGLVAYGLSRGGTELSTLRAIDVATGRILPDEVPFTQRSKVSWVRGVRGVSGVGFYYTAHPAPGSVPPGDEHYYRNVRFHRLGDDPARDDQVFGDGLPKETIVGVDADPGGRWVALSAFEGWSRNDVFLLDRSAPGAPIIPVVVGADGISSAVMAAGRLWLRTNVGSPNYRIDVVDPATLARRTVVPESERPIESFDVTRDRVIAHTLERASSRLAIWTHAGRLEREVELDGVSTVSGPGADPLGDLFGYTVQSFASPPRALVADARDGGTAEVARLELPATFDPAEIVVEQESYRSKDGTEIPMFVVHRRDVVPTGEVPTILTGYGGFNVSRTPMYSAVAATWADAGGLYVVANLRGGAEFGERWHRAGMLGNKQNVFDDFAAAADALVDRGWTNRAHLGISGGSNGGLLVGVTMTQRPDLCAAVVCAVPLLDMLRYQNFLIARLWIAEYGSAEDAAQFKWLRAYSPYHNARAGTRYPAVLFTTAEGDSRVDPSHARKMTALLQWLQRDDPDATTLLRVDRDAGHGIGKPLDKQVEDFADQLAFLSARLRAPERVGTVAVGR